MNPFNLDFTTGERVRLDTDDPLPVFGRVINASPIGLTLDAYEDGAPSRFPGRDDLPPVLLLWTRVVRVWLLDRQAGAPNTGRAVFWQPREAPREAAPPREPTGGPSIRTAWGGGAPPRIDDRQDDLSGETGPSVTEIMRREIARMKEEGSLYGDAEHPYRNKR